ncbi:MAG: class I SAM-dependent methyltransferase [Zoogloeaceae bacterium]|jgi:SAM-dependent methyltransferase|nr:class I SAM-dependent methyltransferase [Zoogloeaceae bacterium]
MKPQPEQAFIPVVDDELEQRILWEIARQVRFLGEAPLVLDTPAGNGRHARAMAALGAQVIAADAAQHRDLICANAQTEGLNQRVDFAAWTFGNGAPPVGERPYDFIFCHHSISLLPYAEAVTATRQLLKSLKIGGKLFISAYGLHSALADGYPGNTAIEERFAPLPAATAKRYDIEGPVCLYSERDLVMFLIRTGAGILNTFTSTHGNVKGIAERL